MGQSDPYFSLMTHIVHKYKPYCCTDPSGQMYFDSCILCSFKRANSTPDFALGFEQLNNTFFIFLVTRLEC